MKGRRLLVLSGLALNLWNVAFYSVSGPAFMATLSVVGALLSMWSLTYWRPIGFVERRLR